MRRRSRIWAGTRALRPTSSADATRVARDRNIPSHSVPATHKSAPSMCERALSVIDDGHVAFLEPAAERDDIAIDPHVREDRLARIDRRGKAHVEPANPCVIVLGDLAQYRAAR